MRDDTARLAYPPGTIVTGWYGHRLTVEEASGMVNELALVRCRDGAGLERYAILAKGKVRARGSAAPDDTT